MPSIFWQAFSLTVTPLNSVTPREYASIVATVQACYDSRWNCYHCLTEYDNRNLKNVEQLVKTKRDVKGCWGKKKPYVIEDVEYYTCIGNYNSQITKRYIDMFDHYEKGIMPFNGSSMEQPCKVIEIFNIIKSVRNQIVEDQRREQEIKNKLNRARKL